MRFSWNVRLKKTDLYYCPVHFGILVLALGPSPICCHGLLTFKGFFFLVILVINVINIKICFGFEESRYQMNVNLEIKITFNFKVQLQGFILLRIKKGRIVISISMEY